MKFAAKIIYKVKPTHPDIGDMTEELWKDKEFTYEDIYDYSDSMWEREDAIEDMKEDLMGIAGGGYNWDHIYDVKFEIEVI